MSRIKSKNTTPEKRLRSRLWSAGYRYFVDQKIGRTRPDLVFKGPKVAVYVDGCFWHGCPTHYVSPRRRFDYWAEKLQANLERDRRLTLHLEALGWTVLRIWECEIEEDIMEIERRIQLAIQNDTHTAPPCWRVARVEPVDDRMDLEHRFLVDLRNNSLRKELIGPRASRSGKRNIDLFQDSK